jgi:hypothetical protein
MKINYLVHKNAKCGLKYLFYGDMLVPNLPITIGD